MTIWSTMEVQGAGTCRHVARKREFSWGNGASHRVLEMVPIKLGWFQRFLRTRFIRKKLLSFSARPIISQWEDPKHGVTLLHVTGAYEISRFFFSHETLPVKVLPFDRDHLQWALASLVPDPEQILPFGLWSAKSKTLQAQNCTY